MFQKTRVMTLLVLAILAIGVGTWLGGEIMAQCDLACYYINYCGCTVPDRVTNCQNECFLQDPSCRLRAFEEVSEGCCAFLTEQHRVSRFYDCTNYNPPPDCECRCYYVSWYYCF